MRTCGKTRLLSNKFRWIRRRANKLFALSIPFYQTRCFFSSLSFFLNNKSKISNFIFFFLSSLSDYDRCVARFEDNVETTEGKEAREKEGLERGLRSARYRWSRPDADRETTRGLPDPFVGLIPRQTPAIFRGAACYVALSSPSTARQTQPLPLPPPHVAAPSPDKVSCSLRRKAIVHYCRAIARYALKLINRFEMVINPILASLQNVDRR